MSGLQRSQYTSLGNMSQVFMDLLSSLTNCLYCFPNSPQLKINNRSFKLQHLLGEGGFSYVYLVSETSTSTLYALKKIRCPFGRESVAQALKEVEAYALFSPHPNIIHAIDHSVESSSSGSGEADKTVYILLPYYRRGNLQDAINANLVNHTHFPERRLMVLFLGVARGLKAMHQYKVRRGPGGPDAQKRAKDVREEAEEADVDAKRRAARRKRRTGEEMEVLADEEQEQPLMEGEVTRSQEGIGDGELRAYAHRDVKPGSPLLPIPNLVYMLEEAKADPRCRQHHDLGHGHNTHSDGLGLPRTEPNPHHFPIFSSTGPGYCCRALHDAIPCA